jgi:predicted transposase/invertase (TIGR01784 family)
LKEFPELHSSEVVNMLFTEWNWDDALAVRFEEGWEKGREEGLERGLKEGWERGREKIARNVLAKGLPLDTIKEITGLDSETIRNIGS